MIYVRITLKSKRTRGPTVRVRRPPTRTGEIRRLYRKRIVIPKKVEFLIQFLDSGPGRRRSPVEWGDFPSVHSFVRPAINQRGLIACKRGLKNSWRGLRAIQRTEGKLEGSEDQPKGSDNQPRESDDQSEGSEGQSEGRGPIGGVWGPIGGVC